MIDAARPPLGTRARLLLAAALLLLTALSATAVGAWAEPAPDEPGAEAEGAHVYVRLVADQASVRPGGVVHLGVLLEPDPDWHVYWKQAGDTGLPPTLTWRLPAGFRAGPPRWPVPTRHTVAGPLTSYLYDDVLLTVAVQAPFVLDGPSVTLTVDVEWLVCEDEEGCVPGEARLALTLPVRDAVPEPSAHAERFLAVRKELPTSAPRGAGMELTPDGVTFRLPKPWGREDDRFEVFWEAWGAVDPLADARIRKTSAGVELTYPWADGDKQPKTLGALLTLKGAETRHAWAFRASGEEADPEATALEPAPAALTSTAPAASPAQAGAEDDLRWAERYVEFDDLTGEAGGGERPSRSLLGVLLLAFLGGLFLNVMPCVLPVLSLKILGFVEQAGSDPVRTRRHGYAFGAGVLFAFVAIAGLLLVLRGAGEQVGWGFQLQQPELVAGLAFLMFAVGLSLFGVFEIGQAFSGLVGRAASTAAPKSYLGSVWMGMLATLIATPCTAPFMGPAVGFALTQPAIAALLVFAMLGVGMAAPYVLLAAFPRWLRFVPKPGPWMVTLKQVMAFPMFATVLWLTWVFSRQVGNDAVVGLLGGLLLFSMGAWLFGRFATPGRGPIARWMVGGTLALAFAVAGWVVALRAGQEPTGAGAARVETAPEGWVPYDGRAIARAQAAGQPVFLDFTADWCLTCKANDAAFLETDTVREAFTRHGILAMQADWTRRDERITQALAKLDRSSVPLYVIVPPDPAQPAVILRTAITTGYVVRALDEVLDPKRD